MALEASKGAKPELRSVAFNYNETNSLLFIARFTINPSLNNLDTGTPHQELLSRICFDLEVVIFWLSSNT